MATGFFLYHLDKTTCGGRILSGASDDTYEIGGVERQQVRDGDPVTCGKHEGRFRVCGGMGDTYEVGGVLKEWAGSLDSYSSCPCRARFVPTVFSHTYESDCNAGRVAEREQAEKRAEPNEVKTAPVPVFAKSCLRGAGCTDAGTEDEPQANFAAMGIYQSQPASPPPESSSTVTSNEPEQHAQAAKKTKDSRQAPVPERKKSLFDKVSGFFFGEAEAMPLPPVVMGGSAEAGMAATAGGATAKLNKDAAKALTYQMKHLSGPTVWESRFELNLPFVVMGTVLHSMLKGEKSDLLTAEQLLAVAQSGGTVPTRVRYNWVEDQETGRLKAVGYHTSPESGRDQVRVRLMEKRFDGKYRFWGDGPGGKVQITWTPADAPGSKDANGWNTGNEGQQAGTVTIPGLEYPDTEGVTVTTLPMPEEKDFRDYILVFPGNVHPPIYIYLSKPPVELLEVDLYSNFTGRARNGTHADHMPSAAAVRAYLRREFPDAKPAEIDRMAKDVASIIIPADIHQKLSATYGGRNSPTQIQQDSRDLRAAVERDIETIRPELKQRGITDSQIDEAKAKMHQLNHEQGLY
ncbi:S-type pyocin domain-containing protein [Enterobacter kobei]|uniref:S-type pyocin domain-containing protein n=1 Tax=Enterobacter kobei TaxID=208224 RepID=UPI000B3C1D1D|nr:S-type pyocin domain-containing protein [Enterobacter kobei]MBT1799027.1 S-type pyocin domain-containing protein [Enterobacter kobei]MBW7696499.1 S-type pyocin domain-containing protein [Enterobacter kobei]MBW7772843.1 S-type pyocin domain-containing protein [Enterobacter kobei]MCK6863569.1 S-type pyocin domain-containing protein [Enterobacter kobei]MCO7419200.1 S-type pyocin domain-containing protein [Enterobacter kobei]